MPLFLMMGGAGFFLTGPPTAQWLGLACIALCLTCAFIGRCLSRIFGRIIVISVQNERMAIALGAQARALEAANAKLRHLSDTDFLIGLWNRRRTMGRHGGEEFLVLLPVASDMMAINVAEELRLAIAAFLGSGGHAGDGVPIPRGGTVSIGVATADGAVAPSRRLEAADRALYAAKKSGAKPGDGVSRAGCLSPRGRPLRRVTRERFRLLGQRAG